MRAKTSLFVLSVSLGLLIFSCGGKAGMSPEEYSYRIYENKKIIESVATALDGTMSADYKIVDGDMLVFEYTYHTTEAINTQAFKNHKCCQRVSTGKGSSILLKAQCTDNWKCAVFLCRQNRGFWLIKVRHCFNKHQVGTGSGSCLYLPGKHFICPVKRKGSHGLHQLPYWPHIKGNLSARRWATILAESEDLGAVFRSEVDKAVADFLDYIKLQKEKGEISIIKDGDKVIE